MAAPKQWHKAFVTLPPEWRVLTYFQRSLMQDYWRLSDADCSGRIEVAGQPVQFLVRLLDLDSKGDRSAAVRETQKLFDRGLLVLTQEPGSVGHVAVRTAVLRPRSGDVPASLPTQLPTSVPNDARTTLSNSAIILKSDLTDREKEESREIEGASFRKPLGEPPPGFVDREQPKEPTLEDRIVALWRKAVSDKGGGQPVDSALARKGAKEVADWLRSNVRENETPLSAFQAALKLYLAEDKDALRRASWPLGWLVERLPGYRIAKQPEKVSSPTHREWVPPDYAAAQRESFDPERIRREREEWFEQYPPAREAWERDQREREEETPAPRVVVSIAEAKPVKRAEPMTEQQRQERIRFLQAQAEQIRAANAAK